MAMQKIFSVRDVRAAAYLKPVFLPNESVMERAIMDALRDENSLISMHPEDYAVFVLGMYDDNEGRIEAHEPVHLFNVVDLKARMAPMVHYDDRVDGE